MSTPNRPGSSAQGNYQAASLLVSPRPNEFGFPLREDEFQILCEGEVSEAKADRNFFLGLSLTASVALGGLAANIDWDAVLHKGRWGPLVWMAIFLALVAGPGLAAAVHHRRYSRTFKASPYSRLIKRQNI